MATDTILSMGRGEVHYGEVPTSTPPNTVVGDVVEFRDAENSTQRRLRLRKVRNGSGGSLTSAAGRAVSYAADGHGLVISGFTKLLCDAHFAGWVDERYEGMTILSNDLFWIVEEGPANHGGQTDDLNPYVAEKAASQLATVSIVEDFQNGSTIPLKLVELTGAGTPTHAVVDAFGGVMNFAHAVNTDNAVGGFKGQNESYLFQAKCPIIFEARVRTNFDGGTTSNFAFGLVNAVAVATLPITDAGALAASFSGIMIYKLEADAVWRAVHGVGATQSIDTDCGAVATATWYTLRIEWIPGATTGVARFMINGVLVHTSSAIAFSGATEMQVVAKCKSGSATDDCSFDIDLLNVHQVRAVTA